MTIRRVTRCMTALSCAVLLLAALHAAEAPTAVAPPPPTPAHLQAAISGGLKWLAAQQIKDGPDAGSWPCRQYPTAVASFAGLAFLANGYQPGQGEYGEVITRALKYVQASITTDGYLGTAGNSMYVHAICTLFGLSCLGTQPAAAPDQALAEWCRQSVKLIVRAQDVRKRSWEQGGWRYAPDASDSDLSVTSWQLLVLHAARQCGYEVEERVVQDALRFVDQAWLDVPGGTTGGYLYRPGVSKEPDPGVTGAAVFVKSILQRESDPRLDQAGALLAQYPPAWGGPQYKGYFLFVSFYMAQGMFQRGGVSWQAFGPALQRILLEHQEGDGHWGFPPDDRTGDQNVGPAYATALSVLILSLEKQYLPMYQRQAPLY